MKKIFLIAVMFLMSFSVVAQEIDLRTGIDFQTDGSIRQSNFLNEAYFSYDQMLGNGFTAEASLQWYENKLNLYTGNVQYNKWVGENQLNFTLGRFENRLYKVEEDAWKNSFLMPTVSDALFSQTGTGLEASFNSKYFTVSASTTAQSNVSFAPDSSEQLFTATARPHTSVSVTGFLYRNENTNAYFGGLVNFNHKFKRLGTVNFGVEYITTEQNSDSVRFDNYSAWLEFAPKVWKGKVSGFGRFDTQDLSAGNYSFVTGVLCRPVDEVTLGALYKKTFNGTSVNTIGLTARVVFMNVGWF